MYQSSPVDSNHHLTHFECASSASWDRGGFVRKEGIEPSTNVVSGHCSADELLAYIVRQEGVEPSILSAAVSKTAVYAIPPPTHFYICL